jgi:hypothetical protein
MRRFRHRHRADRQEGAGARGSNTKGVGLANREAPGLVAFLLEK